MSNYLEKKKSHTTVQTGLEVSRGEGIHPRALLSPMTEGSVSTENREWIVHGPILLIMSTSTLRNRISNAAGLPAGEPR